MLIRIFERIRKHTQLGHQNPTHSTPNEGNAITTDQASLAARSITQYEQDELARRNAMWHVLRSALRGDKDAQYQMGINYLYGQLGLDRSYSHAERWLNEAAHQGHPAAKRALQNAYQDLVF